MKLLWQTCIVLSVLFGLSACNDTAPSPPTGKPVIEANNVKTAAIGISGGKVSSTASNGVTYTLIIPPDALTQIVNISLTPISSMGNAPLASGVVGAVQMEPSGLQFKRAATLRIGVIPTIASGKKLIGFNTANDGSKFVLNLPNIKNGTTELSIYHFSNSGLGTATPNEISQIPALEPLADLTEAEFKAQVDTAALKGTSNTEIADILKTWFTQIVKPLLDAAKDSTNFDVNNKAEFGFERWFDAREGIKNANVGGVDLTSLLIDEDTFARPIVAKHVLALMNDLIAKCQSDTTPDLKMDKLRRANALQLEAKQYDFDTASFGLEKSAFLSKVNACARVVLDPIKLPEIVLGSDKSVDARAQIVFAGDPNPHGAPFEFAVTPTNATLKTPKGFSDADGNFTAVFTPTSTDVSLLVTACLVFELDAPIGSDICVSQTAKPVVKDGIFRGTLGLTGSFVFASSSNPLSSFSETTNVTLESSVEANPNVSSNLKFVQKNASLNYIEKRDRTEFVDAAGGLCQLKVRTVKNATSTGTSTVILTDKATLSVLGTAYSLELLKLNGNQVYQGLDTVSVSLSSGTCDVPPGSSSPFKFSNIDQPYLPNSGITGSISGAGTVVTNPDGSRTISGSKSVNTSGEVVPGSIIAINYTLTWNLTAN